MGEVAAFLIHGNKSAKKDVILRDPVNRKFHPIRIKHWDNAYFDAFEKLSD
jgi:hypothetical protein